MGWLTNPPSWYLSSSYQLKGLMSLHHTIENVRKNICSVQSTSDIAFISVHKTKLTALDETALVEIVLQFKFTCCLETLPTSILSVFTCITKKILQRLSSLRHVSKITNNCCYQTLLKKQTWMILHLTVVGLFLYLLFLAKRLLRK